MVSFLGQGSILYFRLYFLTHPRKGGHSSRTAEGSTEHGIRAWPAGRAFTQDH